MLTAEAVPVDELGELDTSRKIFCANCSHCKLVRESVSGGFLLRVRCDAGKWKKKLGDDKQYKYFTITRRFLDECDSYEPMGDADEFLRELRKNLPLKDEVYTS